MRRRRVDLSLIVCCEVDGMVAVGGTGTDGTD
jgi:hypothetical protein